MERVEPGDDHQSVEDDIWIPSSGDEAGDSDENDDKDDKMDGNDNGYDEKDGNDNGYDEKDGNDNGYDEKDGNDGESGMSDENVLDKYQDSDQETFGIDDISKKVLSEGQSKEQQCFEGHQDGENGTQVDKKAAWSSVSNFHMTLSLEFTREWVR